MAKSHNARVAAHVQKLLLQHFPDSTSADVGLDMWAGYDGNYVRMKWEPGNGSTYELLCVREPKTDHVTVTWINCPSDMTGKAPESACSGKFIGATYQHSLFDLPPVVSDVNNVKRKLTGFDREPDAEGIAQGLAMVFHAMFTHAKAEQ